MKEIKGLVSACKALAAKLAESGESLKTVHAAVALFKEQVESAPTEQADSEKLLAVVYKDTEQEMMLLNITIGGRIRVENLTHALATKYANAVDAVAQKLGYNSLSGLLEVLERAFLTVRMLCSVVLARVSRVAAMSIRRKCEGNGDEKVSEPAEGRLTETRPGSAEASPSSVR